MNTTSDISKRFRTELECFIHLTEKNQTLSLKKTLVVIFTA